MKFVYLISFFVLFSESSFAIDNTLKVEDFISKPEANTFKLDKAREALKDQIVFIERSYFCKNEKKETINYTSLIKLPVSIEMEINGIKIKGDSLQFNITKDCKKLYPISFTSNADQNWLGIDIKKDDVIKSDLMVTDKEETIVYLDSYYPIGRKFYESDKIKKYKEINSLLRIEMGSPFYTIESQNGEKKIFYKHTFFNEKDAEYKLQEGTEVVSTFGITPYIGNKICLDNENLRFVPKILSMEIDYSRFLFSGYKTDKDGYTVKGKNGKSIKLIEFRPYDENAKNELIRLGRICNKKVFAWEKKTGKKMPYSTYFTKDELDFILKNHFYK